MTNPYASLTAASSGPAATHSPGLSKTEPPKLRLLFVTDRADPASALPPWIDRVASGIVVAPTRDLHDDGHADAVLLDVIAEDAAVTEAAALAAQLRSGAVAVFVLAEGLTREQRMTLYSGGVLECLTADEDPEELATRLWTLVAAKHTAAAGLDRLREHARNLDEQLRLAQRLQRDFLPKKLPEVEGASFAARLEAASWVAGDFYDIFRLDERHVGFYVADAVGHGIPAALLTVFVKKSLQTKRIEGKTYALIPPDEALSRLNADLLSAELQEAAFITMLYAIYDEATCEVTYARAGHPKPLLLDAGGSIRSLEGEGPLLGVFPDAKFEARTRHLEPGQRLIFYTDGAERVQPERQANFAQLYEVIRDSSLLPSEVLLESILDAVRAATGGRHLADDVTLVALELDPPPVPEE
jgi:phosphoserine phosphatase RsbU/P